jgi:hypothetical protein
MTSNPEDILNPYIFPIFFVCMWCFITCSISLISGWFFLSRLYPDCPFEVHRQFRSVSGNMGLCVGSYNNCIKVRINEYGIRLSVFFLFRLLHPPIVIPWEKVTSCRSTRFWFNKAVRIEVIGWRRPVFLSRFFGGSKEILDAIIQSWEQNRIREGNTLSN